MLRMAGFAVLCALCLAGVAGAYTLDDVTTQGSYGSGGNTGLLVVDFWPNADWAYEPVDSFAFEVKFDGTINGFELMDVVADNDANFSYAQGGGFLNDVWYTDPETEIGRAHV